MRLFAVLIALFALLSRTLPAQRPDSLSDEVRKYIAIDTSVVALTHVLLLDGTGAAPKPDQTVIIRSGRIAEVGPASAVKTPDGAMTMDLKEHTVIPGMVGMHDHLFYTAAKRGIKVTGHLCSVSFREAVALGIDNLEHGMLTASDFDPAKQPDICPVTTIGRNNEVDVQSQTAKEVIQTLVKHRVPMTSTLAVYEPFVAGRPTK
jgi:hypothetical protein